MDQVAKLKTDFFNIVLIFKNRGGRGENVYRNVSSYHPQHKNKIKKIPKGRNYNVKKIFNIF